LGRAPGARDPVMTAIQLLLAHLVKLALLALLVGVVWRGKLRECWAFPIYVLAILVGNTLASVWPSRFYTPTFWVFKQGAYDLLKMAIAVELGYRAFRAFPGAWHSARLLLLAILASSTALLATLTPRSSYRTLWEWQPGVVTAAIWLLTGTALLVVWYRIPVRDWQRAIMLGLGPYLLVFVTLMDMLRRRGWTIRTEIGVVDSVAYLAVVLYWLRAAWRRRSDSERVIDGLRLGGSGRKAHPPAGDGHGPVLRAASSS
jgi:hypothetical protein